MHDDTGFPEPPRTFTRHSLENMRTASYLLPDPGGEVVRDLVNEIEAQRRHNWRITERNRLLEVDEDMAVKLLLKYGDKPYEHKGGANSA